MNGNQSYSQLIGGRVRGELWALRANALARRWTGPVQPAPVGARLARDKRELGVSVRPKGPNRGQARLQQTLSASCRRGLPAIGAPQIQLNRIQPYRGQARPTGRYAFLLESGLPANQPTRCARQSALLFLAGESDRRPHAPIVFHGLKTRTSKLQLIRLDAENRRDFLAGGFAWLGDGLLLCVRWLADTQTLGYIFLSKP